MFESIVGAKMEAARWVRRWKKVEPYCYMILSQLIAASYTIMCKIIFTQGTSTVVFIVYQFFVATLFMAPFAYFTERTRRPPLTVSILFWIFLLALLGATLFQNLFSASLDFISSTTQSAILNLFPAFTYLLSVAARQEAPELHRLRGLGKLLGTGLSVSGAFVMIFWQGNVTTMVLTSSSKWVVGCVLASLGVLSLSTWLVLQEPVTRKYPAELSVTAMMYFFGTIQSSVLAGFTSRHVSEWRLQWGLELVNIFFGGVINSGVGIFIFTRCARMKGPLFVAVFAPLALLFTAIMERMFLGQNMSTGSIAGSLMIVIGLYVFLWAKSEEDGADDILKERQTAIASPLLC